MFIAQNGKTAQCSVVVTRSITSLSLSPKSKILSVGENVTLTYTQTPSKDVSSETISWSSSNNNVAIVNNGVVTAKAAGTATITIKSSSGKASDTATINVVNNFVVGTAMGDDRGHIIKYDTNGNVIWNKAIAYNSIVNAFTSTSTGEMIVGTAMGDDRGHIIKYDTNGNVIWNKAIAYDSIVRALINFK